MEHEGTEVHSVHTTEEAAWAMADTLSPTSPWGDIMFTKVVEKEVL